MKGELDAQQVRQNELQGEIDALRQLVNNQQPAVQLQNAASSTRASTWRSSWPVPKTGWWYGQYSGSKQY